MSKTVQDYITAVASAVGVMENPKGSNSGPEVTKYLAATGLGPGLPWCAAFLAYYGAQVFGTDWPLPRTASCDVLLSFSRRRQIVYTKPKPGDVFLVMASENDAIHTGIVEKVNSDGKTIQSIEGNSNSDGAREGYAVVRNPARVIARSGRLPLVFVRWSELLPDEENTWTVRKAGDAKDFAKAELINGRPYLPARGLLNKMLGTSAGLSYVAQDNALTWNGKTIPTQVVLREGTAWGSVREVLEAAGCTVDAKAEQRQIVVTPPA